MAGEAPGLRGSFWRTTGFIVVGGALGTLVGDLLAHQVPLLGRTTTVSWHPNADLGVVRYSLDVVFRVNLITLVGAVAGYVVSRRWK